jgi:hypothetical protein
MSKNHCSPSKNTLNNTCYDNNDLVAIGKAYNNVVIKQERICNDNSCILPSNPINLKLNNKDLHIEISNKLQKLCTSDICWTDLDFIKTIKDKSLRNSLLYFTFKPKSTKTTKTWFNTHNINEIMDQYQDLYKDSFKFLGAQPSDFSKIIKVNWTQLKKKNNIGIIFNTDNHLQPGKHWLAVFIDNVNKKVDYFDSLGNLPNKNISSFLKHFKSYNFTINKTEHQRGSNACGVYSCYFIIQRLKGLSFDQITNIRITDKMMTDYRSFLFRPNNIS